MGLKRPFGSTAAILFPNGGQLPLEKQRTLFTMSLGVRCTGLQHLPAGAQQTKKLFVTGFGNWQTMFLLKGHVVVDYGRSATKQKRSC